ncbi:MAG: dihydrofolate reductase family protein [Bacteroidota bacterium]
MMPDLIYHAAATLDGFSRTMDQHPDEAVELVQEDLLTFVRTLKAEATAPIWLCGGGHVASTLLKAGLVDRVVVKLNPVVFGSGIPLFGSDVDQTALTLTGTKVYACGVVLLQYQTAQTSGTA